MTEVNADARARRFDLASPNAARALVLLVVLLAGVATVQWRHSNSLSADAGDRRAIAATAGAFGKALLSYDFTDLTAARERVVRLATKEFGKSYSETFRSGLGTIITRLKATADATVKDVYVDDVHGHRAKAMVVVNSKVRSTAGVRDLIGSYLEMELRRERGGWKVDAVTAVAAARETVTSPPPAPVPGPKAKKK